MSQCPYCGATAVNWQEEVRHMEAEHPEILEERLIEAGFRRDSNGQWVDLRTTDD